MSNIDRLSNPVAEAALLGAMMLENKLIVELADVVQPVDFVETRHRDIFSAMMRIAGTGKRCDALTLRPIFQDRDDCSFGAYLDELVENPAAVAGAKAIARQVADLAGRRQARKALHTAMEALSGEFDKSVAEIVGQVEETVWAAEGRTAVLEELSAGDMVRLAIDRDERINEDPGAVGHSNALVSDLDKALGPLEGGQYTIMAGRPGMGKTSAAMSAALGYAISGAPVLYIIGESSNEQVGLRATADLSFAMFKRQAIAHERLKKGGLNSGERQILDRVRERAELLPIRFVNTGRVDIRRVYSLAARHRAIWAARGHKLALVVVDHIGLFDATDTDGRSINGFEKMNMVSRTLDRMKKDLDVHVLALSQLNRKVEERTDKRPMLSDLRDSGSLEQDADNVVLLYREEVYLREAEPKLGEMKGGKDLHAEWHTDMRAAEGKMDMNFAKTRHGPTSKRTVNFFAKYYAVRGGDVSEYSDDDVLF